MLYSIIYISAVPAVRDILASAEADVIISGDLFRNCVIRIEDIIMKNVTSSVRSQIKQKTLQCNHIVTSCYTFACDNYA